MADLVGFKGEGVWAALSTGRSFAPATLWYDSYADDVAAGDWDAYNDFPRMLGDVDDSGRAAIVGFGNAGTYVTPFDHQARFYYDADGNRVVSLNDGARNFYVGDWIEAGASYYFLGGQRVAKRAAGGVTYLHGDHLGSTTKMTGAASSAQLYEAYGAKRGASEVDTPYRYTNGYGVLRQSRRGRGNTPRRSSRLSRVRRATISVAESSWSRACLKGESSAVSAARSSASSASHSGGMGWPACSQITVRSLYSL